MQLGWVLTIVLLCGFVFVSNAKEETWGEVVVVRPTAHTSTDETFWHSSIQVPEGWIVSFEPEVKGDDVHHLLVYNCPAQASATWENGSPCSNGGDQIMFGWAHNAPGFALPPDTGRTIKGSRNCVVLQIHYSHSSHPHTEVTLRLRMTTNKPKYNAGIYLLIGRGTIPAGQNRYDVGVDCTFSGDNGKPIHAFAFRTHTHSAGVEVSGTRIRNGVRLALGSYNPRGPQAFIPMAQQVEISRGDHINAVCTYNTTGRTGPTHIAGGEHNEMCNLYIMFKSEEPSSMHICNAGSHSHT